MNHSKLMPTELMIGNKLKNEDEKIITVQKILTTDDKRWICVFEEPVIVGDIYPIPIEEKMMPIFRFKKKNDNQFLSKKFILEKDIDDKWIIRLRASLISSIFLRRVEYVHEVQNIISVLTGQYYIPK